MKARTLIIAGAILVAALTRLLPHPWNFASITALALFGGATFSDRRWALATPLMALVVSDCGLEILYRLGWSETWGFYRYMWVTYGATVLITLIGILVRRRRNVLTIAGGTLAGSVVFFLVTNFAFIPGYDLYPHTWQGLVTCYTAAIPFFRNSLVSDALYATALFGGFALVERWLPALREARVMPARGMVGVPASAGFSA
jgi:hypothetical protein